MLSWSILSHLMEPRVLKMYRSVIELAMNVVMAPNEAYGVVATASYVLVKALEIYEDEAELDLNREQSEHEEDVS